LLGKLLSDKTSLVPTNNEIIYSTDPYDPKVELVFLNTCGFISSGREEALATVKKLLKKGKKVCIT
jgi:tRNA A37 methylthiotransferase MiaB